MKNFSSAPFSLPTSIKVFLRDYYQQYKRKPLEHYTSVLKDAADKEKPYIFLIGTLWKETDNAKSTNEARKKFIEASKKIENCNFEGGLFATKDHSNYKANKELIFSRLYPISEYITKTKDRSPIPKIP